MKTWKKAALLTAAIAVPAFLLGPVLFPKGPDFPTMTRIEFALRQAWSSATCSSTR
jgi:hypothetical protein